jgi:hypothetical protein
LVPYSSAENCAATITARNEISASEQLSQMGVAVVVDVPASVLFDVADEGKSERDSVAVLEVLSDDMSFIESSYMEFAPKKRKTLM